MRMQGKRVLVTGASRGIGRGMAQAMAAAGAHVAVNYARQAEAAEAVVAAIVGAGGQAFALQADVASPEACRLLIDESVRRLGGLDVLVNNAGVLDPIPPGEVLVEAFQHTLDVSLKATWILSRLAAPALKATQGAIVNIASIAGLAGYPYASHYAAAKAGVVAVTQSMALELAPLVRVNAIAPGYTNTGDPNGWNEERMGDFARSLPLGRFGRPEDVARAAIYLAVEATYVTGTTLVVDGGLTLKLPGFMTGL